MYKRITSKTQFYIWIYLFCTWSKFSKVYLLKLSHKNKNPGNDSPTKSIPGQEMDADPLPNEISAPYEVPQFPIEQIEKKLQIQRQMNNKWVFAFHLYNYE